MTRRRPILFWPLAVAATAAALWWAFHVPRRPDRLYTAVPAQASFVSAHRDLAARWDEVSANPLTQSLFSRANMNVKDWASLNRDPQFRDWLGRLASDEFVLAFVPGLAAGEDGWVFASWLGGRSQRLRLALQLSEVPGITYAGMRRGWPVWTTKPRMFKGPETLAFSLVDGMLVASFSAGGRGIETVLSCVDGRYPSLALSGKERLSESGPADRGWFRLAGSPQAPLDAPRVQFALDDFTSARLSGSLRIPCAWFEGAGPLSGAAPAALAGLQTDLPSAVLVAPAASAALWIAATSTDVLSRAFADLVREQASGPLFASLFTGDYRGTFFNMRMPAVAVGAACTNPAALGASLSAKLAAVNAAHPWALEAIATNAGASQVWSVAGGARDTWYGHSEPGDRICFTAGPDWVLAASSAAAWSNVVRDAVLREARPSRLGLAAQAAARHDARAYAWVSLPDSAPAIRQGVGSYTLRLRSEKTDAALRLRQQINRAASWIANLQRLGHLELWASPVAGAATEVRFETTPVAP